MYSEFIRIAWWSFPDECDVF